MGQISLSILNRAAICYILTILLDTTDSEDDQTIALRPDHTIPRRDNELAAKYAAGYRMERN